MSTTTSTRTRPRARTKAAAAAPKKTKSRVDAKIQVMTRQLKGKEGSIEKKRQEEEELARGREKARGELLRLTSEKKSLQDAINTVKLQSKAFATEREAAEAELKVITAEQEELRKQIRKDKRFTAINVAVDEVDTAIREQRDKVEALEKDVAAAQREADAVSRKAGDLEADRRAKQEELRSLPDRVREARGQLTRLVATMKAALTAGRIWEAHALESDVNDAVKRLQKEADRKQETAVVGTVLASGKQTAAQRKAEAAARTLAKAKDDLQKERLELQKRTQERQKRIREKLDASPK